MTIEERVARLEAQFDTLDRLEHRLVGLEQAVVGLRSDFGAYRSDFARSQTEHGRILERILGTLEELQKQRPTILFRWPWEPAR